MEAAGDFEAPKLLWVGDTTPRTWFGHTFPGAALANDNPDTVYRQVFLDGGAQYEITGRIPVNGGHFVIEPLPEVAGVIPASGTRTGPAGTTEGPALLTGQELRCEGDGSFRIVLGGPALADAGNQISTPPTPMAINLRDILSNWAQQPFPLTIRRLSPPSRSPLSEAALRLRILDHLPAYLRHYAGFKDRYRGGIKANAFVGPLGRAGAWSYILSGRYALAQGQAIVLSAHPNGARYQGIQVADQWAVSFDNARRQGSLNNDQALANGDGSFTYVIAAEDPGVANWLDTSGCRDGFFVIRWLLYGPGFEPNEVMRRFELVKLENLNKITDLAAIGPAERSEQLAKRFSQYSQRISV
jgi:hypothetical protein